MAQSKKRRHSVSPERSQQPQDTVEHKKRKLNNAVSSEASNAGPSRGRVGRSPVPLASDSSATLDGDSPHSKEKGKGKAVEKDSIMLELEQLRKEVAHKNELLEKNENAVAALLQALSCHVCLETMCMPYALTCGHMACQTCLVSWFTSTKSDHNNDAEDPDLDWYSDEASDAEADGPNPQAGPAANGFHANVPNGHSNANQNVNGNGDVHHPAPAAPAHAPALNAASRRKTCPHCRCIIKQRPIQIYPVKDIIGILAPGVKQETQASSKKVSKDTDPWKGIFPPAPKYNAGDDDDDDAPWPGFGGMPGVPPPQPEVELDHEPFEHLVPIANPAPIPPPPPPPPPFIDEEDGVRRCGACLHEVWGGACTNGHCDVDYGGDGSDDSEDGVELYDENFHGDEEDEGGHQEHQSDAVDGDVEDGYESSFIDDTEEREGLFRRLQRRYWPSIIEEGTSSDARVHDEDDFIPGPSRRYSSGIQESIVISSDDENDIQMPRRIRRGRTRQIIDVDEEEHKNDEVEEEQVEGDVRSADERPFPINDFVSEHQFTEPSAVHYIEEDDEYYGNEEVPYVWDEDEDAEGNSLDNVVYLQEDEEDGEGYEF